MSVGSLDEFLMSLQRAGVSAVTLQFSSGSREAVPCGDSAGPTPPSVVAAESNPLDMREAAEASAAAEAAQIEEDRYAATPVRPASVADLMSQCDEEFGAWQSEQVTEAERGSVLVVERVA